MECRLPMDKVVDLWKSVGEVLSANKVTLRVLQSLLGKLNFACRIIPMGRIFSRRLALATGAGRQPHHHIRVTAEHKADLRIWYVFLQSFNGRNMIQKAPTANEVLELYTDAAGARGFGAYFRGYWCAQAWPARWHEEGWTRNLTLLELFPIVITLWLWGDMLRHHHVVFHSDNMSVVQAINSTTASSPPVVRLLRQLVLKCLQLNILVRASHIAGVKNVVADALSRFEWEKFQRLAPFAKVEPTLFNAELWNLCL
ncbi:uncharacterized protein O3C94_014388 [Discoglossus pictus]